MIRLAVLAVAAGVPAVFGATAATADTPPIPTPIGVGPLFHPGVTTRRCRRPHCRVTRLHARGGAPIGGSPRAVRARPGRDRPRRDRHRAAAPPARARTSSRGAAPTPRGRASRRAWSRSRRGAMSRSATSSRCGGGRSARAACVGFHGCRGERVRAYVDGTPLARRSSRDPARRHAEIVLELGRFIPPHTSVPLRERTLMTAPVATALARARAATACAGLLVALSACGSSSSGVATPTIAAAKTFQLAGFQPAASDPGRASRHGSRSRSSSRPATPLTASGTAPARTPACT